MANIERMRENLAAIREFPDQHDQSDWCAFKDSMALGELEALKADNGDHPPCGTTLCFAGWDAFLHAPKGSRIRSGEYLALPGGAELMEIGQYAQQGMELTEDQARVLFFRARSADDLEALTAAIEADPEIGEAALYAEALAAAKAREAAEDASHWEMYVLDYEF